MHEISPRVSFRFQGSARPVMAAPSHAMVGFPASVTCHHHHHHHLIYSGTSSASDVRASPSPNLQQTRPPGTVTQERARHCLSPSFIHVPSAQSTSTKRRKGVCGRMTSILICHFMGWGTLAVFAVRCTLNSTFTSTSHVRSPKAPNMQPSNGLCLAPICLPFRPRRTRFQEKESKGTRQLAGCRPLKPLSRLPSSGPARAYPQTDRSCTLH
ncbi:hypothetical protein BGZ61DRAFT_34328 [Ilyonectria robusta]|uniref:uncharacterized protein n=1 Tax=Ilyonectria robusta TaxID=1079257 RepID=UPI001E8D4952|nr:uncharacterized protein BGZ61DRAFT_34328 [Ilyonectria robusta]KAH8694687.1 hypothetical protein BGZ61DRAFT_34328 [Ilyonectria robusta]